jgi:hypothetical protein
MLKQNPTIISFDRYLYDLPVRLGFIGLMIL